MKEILFVILMLVSSVVYSRAGTSVETINKYIDLLQKNALSIKGELYYSYDVYDQLREVVEYEIVELDKLEGPIQYTIFSNYNINELQIGNETAKYEIIYNVIGNILDRDYFIPEVRKVKKVIKMINKNAEWKIYSVSGGIRHTHYVNVSKVLSHLKKIQILDAKKENKSNSWLRRTITQINELRYLEEHSMYNAELSFDTLLGLLFFNKNIDLTKGTVRFQKSINNLNKVQKRKLKNVIYARYQYAFTDKNLTKYYRSIFPLNFYAPQKRKVELSELDKKNIGLLN